MSSRKEFSNTHIRTHPVNGLQAGLSSPSQTTPPIPTTSVQPPPRHQSSPRTFHPSPAYTLSHHKPHLIHSRGKREEKKHHQNIKRATINNLIHGNYRTSPGESKKNHEGCPVDRKKNMKSIMKRREQETKNLPHPRPHTPIPIPVPTQTTPNSRRRPPHLLIHSIHRRKKKKKSKQSISHSSPAPRPPINICWPSIAPHPITPKKPCRPTRTCS